MKKFETGGDGLDKHLVGGAILVLESNPYLRRSLIEEYFSDSKAAGVLVKETERIALT